MAGRTGESFDVQEAERIALAEVERARAFTARMALAQRRCCPSSTRFRTPSVTWTKPRSP